MTRLPPHVKFGLALLGVLTGVAIVVTVARAVRKWTDRELRLLGKLEPRMQGLARELLERAHAAGYAITLTDGFRSDQAQEELYAQGRTKPGAIATNARAGESPHNYGAAIDFAFLVNGKLDSDRSWADDQPWEAVARIGESLGLKWGGAFGIGKGDKVHFELPDWKNLRPLV